MRLASPRLLPLILLWIFVGCRSASNDETTASTEDPTPAYAALLQRVVSEAGYVDYERLKAERGALDAYVSWLAERDLPAARARHRNLALYLNVFTAWSLYFALEEGQPAEGIRWRHRPGLGIFFEPRLRLGPDVLSLSEIAHERLRMLEMEPAVHGALTCAAVGCPPMRSEPWTPGPTMRAQLREQMGRWLNDEVRGLRIQEDRVLFSPIFDWFSRDFSFWTAGQDLCSWAAHYSSPARRARLIELSAQGCPHGFFEYDPRLNSIEHGPPHQGAPPDPAPLLR